MLGVRPRLRLEKVVVKLRRSGPLLLEALPRGATGASDCAGLELPPPLPGLNERPRSHGDEPELELLRPRDGGRSSCAPAAAGSAVLDDEGSEV